MPMSCLLLLISDRSGSILHQPVKWRVPCFPSCLEGSRALPSAFHEDLWACHEDLWAWQAADEESNATLFGTDQRSAAAKVRELLTSAAGAAKEELLASARDVANRVLPMAQLTDALSHDAPEENRKLDPIEVSFPSLRRSRPGIDEDQRQASSSGRRPMLNHAAGHQERHMESALLQGQLDAQATLLTGDLVASEGIGLGFRCC